MRVSPFGSLPESVLLSGVSSLVEATISELTGGELVEVIVRETVTREERRGVGVVSSAIW